MDVLYIPFAGQVDLVRLAQIWQTNRNYKDIIIYQHGDDLPDSLCQIQALKVYVLAHGIDDPRQTVVQANHQNGEISTIDMETLADRFNYDLAYVHSKIKKIKLYFCNTVGHQDEFAHAFEKHLVLFDTKHIDVYQGNLYPPTDPHSQKQANSGSHQYPAAQGRKSLFFSPDKTLVDPSFNPHTSRSSATDDNHHDDEYQLMLDSMQKMDI